VNDLYQGWKLEGTLLKKIPQFLISIVGLALVQATPAASATLFGETLDANITISGEDDNGFYTLPVLVGPVVVGASGFSDSIPVFKQLTEDGFATASNQITGNVTVTIGADTISVEMQGQVQPFELESKFSGIGAASFQIAADADSATGTMSGVNLDLFDSDTSHSVDFATFYLGFQPGTDLTQTETLTFATGVGGGAVPEPSTWMLLLAGFAGLGFAGLSRSRRRVEVTG
jgi:PEP-CTERM motif